MHQDVVAVQLLPRNQWVAPSSVVLQDEGIAKDDDAEEEEDEEKAVSWGLTEMYNICCYFEIQMSVLKVSYCPTCS